MSRTARNRKGRPRAQRGGMAVIIVLSIIAMSLAASYAILRAQGTTLKVLSNTDLRAAARQAAQTAYNLGLQAVHSNTWTGADTTISGNITATSTYSVAFTTGDSSLTSTSSNYSENPYRLTMLATGTAKDPANTAVSVSYQIKAILKLVPRQLRTEPTDWSAMTAVTLYQTRSDDVVIDARRRVEGTVRLQGKVVLYEAGIVDGTSQSQYLTDLRVLNTSNGGGLRPFNGQVNLPFNRTPSSTQQLLTNNLALTIADIAETSVGTDWTFPTATTYRLYKGGKNYTLGTVNGTLSNTTLQANPATNPAGLFYASSNLTIGDNVTINGTLLCNGSLTLSGASFNASAVNLPSLRGTTTLVKLPALVANGRLTVSSTATGAINGMVCCFGEFKLNSRAQATTFGINGRLIAQQITLLPPTDYSSLTSWDWAWIHFWWSQQRYSWGGISNYASYCSALGLGTSPTFVLRPETTTTNYHWQTNGNSIFVKHTNDPGLRWDVLQITEIP